MPFAGPIPDSAQVPDTRRQQFELQQEVAHLQRQAAALNHPDTFAQVWPAGRLAESGLIWYTKRTCHASRTMHSCSSTCPACPSNCTCPPPPHLLPCCLLQTQSAKAERKAIALAKELAKLQEQAQVITGWFEAAAGGLASGRTVKGMQDVWPANATGGLTQLACRFRTPSLVRRRLAHASCCGCPACCALHCWAGWCINPVSCGACFQRVEP